MLANQIVYAKCVDPYKSNQSLEYAKRGSPDGRRNQVACSTRPIF